MAKSNKIEELIAGYLEVECVVSVIQRQKLTTNKLNLSYFGNSHCEGLWIYPIYILNSFYIKPKS